MLELNCWIYQNTTLLNSLNI